MCVERERAQLLAKLVEASHGTAPVVRAFLELEAPTEEQVRSFARRYLGLKFLTGQPPEDGESLYELGQASYQKAQTAKRAGASMDEWNTGCTGASSAMTRKVLFFLALQRDLQVKFQREEIERAETVGDVANLCVKYCRGEERQWT